jgi:hypothetical protein
VEGQAEERQGGLGRLERTRARSLDALAKVAESDRVQAARERAGEGLRRVGQTDLNETVARGRRAIRGDNRCPRTWLIAWVLVAAIAMGTTFLSWLRVDVSEPASGVSDRIPSSLLGALDHGFSLQEAAGLGFALTAIMVVALAFGVLGYALRRWYWWVAAAGVQVLGVGVAAVGLVVALGARAATGWVLPSDWEPYAPEVSVGVGSLAYMVAAAVFVVASLRIAMGSRRRWSTAARQPGVSKGSRAASTQQEG